MGCDGSRVTTDDLLDRLRALAGAAAAVRRAGRRPGRLGRRRSGPRRAARPRAARPRSRRGGRRGGGRAAARRGRGTARPLRHRHGRRRGQRRRRPAGALRAPGCAARGRAGRADRRGPGTPRLQRQRDRGSARRRARLWRCRARSTTSPRAGCARCTPAPSSTTRHGCCGSCATARGCASRSRRRRGRGRSRRSTEGALATVTGSRLGAELRLALCEPQPTAVCGLEGLRLGPQLLPAFRVDPDLVERAQRLTPEDARADLVALAACCLDAGEADAGRAPGPAGVHCPRARDRRRRGDPRALAGAGDGRNRQRVRAVGAAAPRGARDGRSGRRSRRARGRRTAGSSELRHARLAIGGDDLLAAGLSGPAIGRALEAATAAMLDGEAVGPGSAVGGGGGGGGSVGLARPATSTAAAEARESRPSSRGSWDVRVNYCARTSPHPRVSAGVVTSWQLSHAVTAPPPTQLSMPQ